MLSLKRLGYVLLIVLSVCAIFFIYNINEDNNKIVEIKSKVVEDEPLIKGEPVNKTSEPHFYIIGNDGKKIYKDIYNNVCEIMGDLKLSYSELSYASDKELKDIKNILVFCDEIISDYVSLPDLEKFISKGGKVVFAAGISEGNTDTYANAFLGIREKTIKEAYNSFECVEEFLPLKKNEMSYSSYNTSTWIAIRDKATVYLQEIEKQVPIIYSYPYEKGKVLVFNTTFLSDISCIGFFVGGLGSLMEDFVYPVLGVSCVYLDNFPAVTYVNDPICVKLYGRTTESFVRDVVWTVFQGMAVRNNIKYTSSVLSISDEKDAFPEVSESLFSTMGKSALQFDGELSYAFRGKDGKKHINTEFVSKFEQIFRNYKISSLVMMRPEDMKETAKLLGEDVVAIRGYIEDEEPQKRLNYEDGHYVFPQFSNGIDLGDSGLKIASGIAGYGIISHTFDIDNLINIDENSPVWDTNKIKLQEFEKQVFSKTDYLKDVTLTETKNYIKSYISLDYTWERKENVIEISCNNVIDGQAFMLRTTDKIDKAENATIEEIGDTYYMVRVEGTKARIILK